MPDTERLRQLRMLYRGYMDQLLMFRNKELRGTLSYNERRIRGDLVYLLITTSHKIDCLEHGLEEPKPVE